jgi:hypothetical protein
MFPFALAPSPTYTGTARSIPPPPGVSNLDVVVRLLEIQNPSHLMPHVAALTTGLFNEPVVAFSQRLLPAALAGVILCHDLRFGPRPKDP